MTSQIFKISEIMEDIKEKISDNEYKIIMDNLMNLHNNNNNSYTNIYDNITHEIRRVPRTGRIYTKEEMELATRDWIERIKKDCSQRNL